MFKLNTYVWALTLVDEYVQAYTRSNWMMKPVCRICFAPILMLEMCAFLQINHDEAVL